MANHPNRGKSNGHRNWAHWNVSLWINNDEGLYNLARRAVQHKRREAAAAYVLESLREAGITRTPDGAVYSVSSVRAALRGM